MRLRRDAGTSGDLDPTSARKRDTGKRRDAGTAAKPDSGLGRRLPYRG
jgi:hypothetical protein